MPYIAAEKNKGIPQDSILTVYELQSTVSKSPVAEAPRALSLRIEDGMGKKQWQSVQHMNMHYSTLGYFAK